MHRLVKAIADASPKFNTFLLVDYPRQSIEAIPADIDRAWRYGLKMIDPSLTYVSYEVVRPHERARIEMDGKTGRTIAGSVSEVLLVKYRFTHTNKDTKESREYSSFFYTPFMKDRTLVIRGKRMAVVLGVTEQVFSRLPEKSGDGVMIRPIRAPVKFGRRETIRISAVGDPYKFHEFILIGYLYSKSTGKRALETTVLLYLNSKFGFNATVERLGLNVEDFTFVPDLNKAELGTHYFFPASKTSKSGTVDVFLRVRKQAMSKQIARKFVANLLYTLQSFNLHSVSDLMDPQGTVYRVMLGKILNPSYGEMQALNSANSHIASIDMLLDPITKERFQKFIPEIGENIYDVLYYVFIHIDQIMVNNLPQDLYSKRIDAASGIFVEAYAKPIYHRLYHAFQKTTLRAKEVVAMLRTRPMAIDAAINAQRGDAARNINSAPTISNDSWLASCGIAKHRPDGSPKLRFDPSMAVVESVNVFSGNKVGNTGGINPMLQIDKDGRILHPEYCREIDALSPYLPR